MYRFYMIDSLLDAAAWTTIIWLVLYNPVNLKRDTGLNQNVSLSKKGFYNWGDTNYKN